MPADFRGKSVFIVQLWWLVEALLFHPSPQFMFGWRRFLLRAFGAKIGNNVKIRSSVKTTYPWKLTVGDNSWIGDECTIYNLDHVTIGSNVAVAHKVYFNTGGHDYKTESFKIFAKPITVEDECWITNDVYIAPDITIGKGTVVGARSTVLHSLPSGQICVGSPARVLKSRI